MIDRHIAISGELGSGKSAVARKLADAHSRRLVSTGDIQRSLAESLRLSTLETNWLAEKDEGIDSKVDGVTRDLGQSAEPIIFDSRMAWRMVPTSIKVHLLVDSGVAAVRLHQARSTPVEGYESSEEAKAAAEDRYQSERRRFLAKYHVDVSHLRNYDIVIDSTSCTIDQVVHAVESALSAEDGAVDDAATGTDVRLMISPQRILPGFDSSADDHDNLVARTDSDLPQVGYSRPFFFLTAPHPAVEDALRRQDPLIEVKLVAEDTEPITPTLTANDYPRQVLRPEWIDVWEQRYGVHFSQHPASVAG